MSGGHFGHAGVRLRNELEDIGQDESVMERWPLTAAIFYNLGDILYKAEHEMDWDLSGDSHIKDDAEFDKRTWRAIIETCSRNLNQPNNKKVGT